MKKILTICLILATITCYSQDKHLVADETWLSTTTKSMKITSSNDVIKSMIFKQFKDSITGYNVKYKKDRMGRYEEVSILLPIKMMPQVLRYIKETVNQKP